MNLENAKDEFLNYTRNYDLENDEIKRKQLHSLRVMEISKQIAERLHLSEEEINVAALIGLLHDIARFEQFIQFKTFKDIDSIDHGDIGAKILAQDIRKYIEIEKYDEIIIKAVKNHNKYKIEVGLSDKESLFAKIIRDADKIDILYESVEMFWRGQENRVEESVISEETINEFNQFVQVKMRIDETPIDDVVKVIAFIFDINFDVSFEIIKEKDFINKILNRYDIKDEYTREKVEEIKLLANKYIKTKKGPAPNGYNQKRTGTKWRRQQPKKNRSQMELKEVTKCQRSY